MPSIDQWIHHWSEHRGDHLAVQVADNQVTYRQLSDAIHATAGWMLDRGVEHGDRVAFIGANRVEQITALFACARVGAMLLPLNNRLTAAEHVYQLSDADPAVVLATDGFAAHIADADPNRQIVDLDVDPFPTAGAVVEATGRDSDGVLMVYTSGTTGHPKGAVHTQSSLLFAILNAVTHQDLGTDDIILTSLPLFHVGGLNIQTLPALYAGATVHLQSAFDPAEALAIIRTHRPTQTLQVPATMAALLAHPDLESTDLSCLAGMNSGSSVIPAHLIRALGDLGVRVGQTYGATETGPTALVLRYADSDRIGSCGKPAMHTELRIVDEAGTDVTPGEPGELWLRGPHMFREYWGLPETTNESFVDGWYRTGDVGRRDVDGFVYIEDRVKDMVISGGENVYPAEVENVLAEHPALAEVTVLGRADDRWGEVPVAVAVIAAGQTEPTIEELRAWCVDRLARYKQPRELITVDQLPRTALGKVTKHILRDRLFGNNQ